MFQLSEYKPEMKFYCVVKNSVLITFHRRRKKMFVLLVVEVKWPVKKCKKTIEIHKSKHVGGSNAEIS